MVKRASGRKERLFTKLALMSGDSHLTPSLKLCSGFLLDVKKLLYCSLNVEQRVHVNTFIAAFSLSESIRTIKKASYPDTESR